MNETGATEVLANLSVETVVMIALALTFLRLALLSFKAPGQRPGSPPEVMPWARSIAEILESLIIAGVLVFLIIRPFFVQAFFIPSESMENTLLGHDAGTNPMTGENHTDTVHDHIFVNKLVYRYSEPHRGDIIVFKAPARADQEDIMNHRDPKENILIKRLIGIPGDTMEVREDTQKINGQDQEVAVMYRNGEKLTEPYIKEPMNWPQPTGAVFAEGHPLKLGPGQLFVMGDNRNDSNDSRFWGTLERSRVIGKASFIFFPFNRIRVLH